VPAGTVAVSVDWKVGVPLVGLSLGEKLPLAKRLTVLQGPESPLRLVQIVEDIGCD
jgi:hypothetical protein